MSRAYRPVRDKRERVPVGILVSGSGSNMQAIISAARVGEIPVEVAVVISNKPDVYALERAERENIPTVVVDHRDFETREDFEDALIKTLQDKGVQWVCLAGFMRLLTSRFIAAFPHRILNVHPALLPSFPGLHGAAKALKSGVKVTGCTVHLVTEEMDAGPIVAQATVPVFDDDTEETLTARIQAEEHQIFPMALGWMCQGRGQVEGRTVRLMEMDGE
jgi:phosphoribosylglycinamide formyltransferase-1